MTEYSDISPELLKVAILLADLISGIIYQSGIIAMNEAKNYAFTAILLPGGLFILFVILYLITARLLLWEECENLEKVKLFILGIISSAGLTVHFFADNYYIVEQIHQDVYLNSLNGTEQTNTFRKINSVQVSLMIIALVFYRAIPHAVNLLSKECCSSLSDCSTKSIYTGLLNVVATTIEFDFFFTLLQGYYEGDCSTQSSVQLKFVWGVWSLFIVLYTSYLIASVIITFL